MLYGLPSHPARSYDQVLRLRTFEDAHPDIEIIPPDVPLSGDWTAKRDGAVIESYDGLRGLLDLLEMDEEA